MDRTTLDKLGSQNWGVIIIKLTAYVENRVNRTSFAKGETLLGGYTSEDIAQQAIALVYEGKRKWDYLKYPDLLEYLMFNVAKSLVSNLWKSPKQKLRDSFEHDQCDDEDFKDDPLSKFGIEDDFEREIFAKELLEEIESKLGENDELWQIFNYRIEGYKNQEIAKELDVSTSVIEAAIKRLKRELIHIKKIQLQQLNSTNYESKREISKISQ